MRTVLVAVLAMALVCLRANAQQEKLTLTTPVNTGSIADYQIVLFSVMRTPSVFSVELKPNNPTASAITCRWGSPMDSKGLTCTHAFTNPDAPTGYASVQAMMSAFNKTNFAAPNPSINKWICAQLIADGAFTGTCTGTPAH